MQTKALVPSQIWANGRIYTLDAHDTIDQAVAVNGGHFLTIG